MDETNPPVLEPLKAIARCGKCGRELFEYSEPRIGCNDGCPLYGPEWRMYQRAQRMQNVMAPSTPPENA